MVIRYFGSKDSLFALTVDFQMGSVAPPLARDTTPGQRGVRHFLQLWEGEDAIEALPVLLRTASSNALAAEKLRRLFELQIRGLIEHLAGHPVNSECAGLIASQMLGFAYCRYILLIEPVASMAPDRVVTLIGASVDHHLQMDGTSPKRADEETGCTDPTPELRNGETP